ncbi:hypothetical protein Q5752_004664 [Cryptotrichosporon argae]
MTRLLILGPVVHSLALNELVHLASAAICVFDGIIQWLEPCAPTGLQDVCAKHGVDVESFEIVELTEGFLCPGLIDTHTHAPQYPNIGLGQQYELLEWLDKLTFPQEARFSDTAYARATYDKVVQRNLAAGTTTCCYYGTLHTEGTAVLADVCAEQGQRAFIGKCNMDRLCPEFYVERSAADSLAATHAFLAHFAGLPPTVRPILTPRFALSCTPELLGALGALAAAHDLPVQTHLSENPQEVAIAKQLFPDCATYAAVYEKHGLLGPATILAHCVHLDDNERDVIRKAGAGISHCPCSNLNLNSGAARVVDMLDAGIKVGLGTDCSGGHAIGILSAVRSASDVSKTLALLGRAARALTVPELFHMATLGGAALCRLDGAIGNFAPGKHLDALWVRPRSPGMWIEPGEAVERVFEKWLFTGDDRDVAAVWVDGRKVR